MGLESISPGELSVLANIVALALAADSADENNVLGNFIVSVGSLLLTIAAQQVSLEAAKAKNQVTNNKVVG